MTKPIYRSYNATELLHYAENILLKMTQNAELFPAPTPSLTILEDSLNTYREAYAEATFRDKRAVVLKGQKGDDLQQVIYRLSQYVDIVADGDEAVILAAGFRPTLPKTNRLGRTPQAEHVRIEVVKIGTGVVRIRVKPWPPARLYRYDYRKMGTETWESILSSKSTLEVSMPEMLLQYEFRVSYLGRDTEPNFSNTVTALVV